MKKGVQSLILYIFTRMILNLQTLYLLTIMILVSAVPLGRYAASVRVVFETFTILSNVTSRFDTDVIIGLLRFFNRHLFQLQDDYFQ